MKTCKDCIHHDVCAEHLAVIGCEYLHDFGDEQIDCKHFKDKSLVLDLPCKPVSVMSDGNKYNFDVYCPYCGTNLSGLYGDEPTEIIQCYNCGNFLDNTKVITKEAAEQALKEREQG